MTKQSVQVIAEEILINDCHLMEMSMEFPEEFEIKLQINCRSNFNKVAEEISNEIGIVDNNF